MLDSFCNAALKEGKESEKGCCYSTRTVPENNQFEFISIYWLFLSMLSLCHIFVYIFYKGTLISKVVVFSLFLRMGFGFLY